MTDKLTLIKSNKAGEKFYDYNGKYAGYISRSGGFGKYVYYALPADVVNPRMYASLSLAKECLLRHAMNRPEE